MKNAQDDDRPIKQDRQNLPQKDEEMEKTYAIPARKILLMFMVSFATFVMLAQMLRTFFI